MPVTHTPWAPTPAGGRAPAPPSSPPAERPAHGPGEPVGPPPRSERPTHRADPPPYPAGLGAQLAAAAGSDRAEARRLARLLAASLTPTARLVLLDALAEAGTPHGSGRPGASGSDRAPARETAPPPCGPETAPGGPGPGRDASRSGPPSALIRLRFADTAALERAGAAFGARLPPGLGRPSSDRAALTLRLSGDAGTQTLRAVLAVLETAAVTAESLTVHTHELDDVFAAFTGLP
ncbi:hypothetical protein ACWD5F_44160 [Streptomyces sp. NPDC002499]